MRIFVYTTRPGKSYSSWWKHMKDLKTPHVYVDPFVETNKSEFDIFDDIQNFLARLCIETKEDIHIFTHSSVVFESIRAFQHDADKRGWVVDINIVEVDGMSTHVVACVQQHNCSRVIFASGYDRKGIFGFYDYILDKLLDL